MNIQIRVATTVFGCLLALTLQPAARAESPPSFERIEQRAFEGVNAERKKDSLGPYKPSKELADLAREHARKIASGEVEFGHDGFEGRQAKIFAALGANHAAENVGWNNADGEEAAVEAVAKWMHSKEHRGHILGPFEWAGVGVARSASGTYYFTLLMGGPWPLPES